MYRLKHFSILSIILLSASAAQTSQKTTVRVSFPIEPYLPNTAQVGIATADKSRGVDVPLNECHAIEEEWV